MMSLFPIEYTFPPGFTYEEDFLSHDEERELIKAVKATELHKLIFQGFEAKRKTASFGYDYNSPTEVSRRGKIYPKLFNR